MRIAFAGTPVFAARALEALHAAGHTVALVLTQPDRPAGRGMKLQPSPVKQFALAQGLPLAQPQGLKLDGRFAAEAQAAQAALQAAEIELMVVAAYGLILPDWTLKLPPRGCLNIHASLLPRWRGAAPIHRAIEAGDAETGTTIMQMDAGLDTGDMLSVERLPIAPDENTAHLHDRLAAQGARLIVDTLARLDRGEPLPATPQPAEGACYAAKIDKAEATIDWSLPASTLARRVLAFDPAPGAHFTRTAADGRAETIKLWRARPVPGQGQPGEVLALDARAGVLHVACGEGALQIDELQRPGGKRLPARELLPALALQVGERLGG
ncbi:methionyl-tRNA formyltransferase [Piscinibacter sp. Jin2]|uniref:Methionyl-tRNA formyltransferase n=1 Tax=Aquariibacter lacus TaxID=2801332 RepID=A0A9X1BMM6_9BURK|nr:methionyl-tRNA formyltransferase [Piscinibacter lacus]MBL0718350.1 methionyl-tRNA formyltransferase [Piscinibacter lacus]